MLSTTVDLLPKLLLPLAGPEEFDEEDNDKLPIDLQYLGEDKCREVDPDIRKMLIEALTQVSYTINVFGIRTHQILQLITLDSRSCVLPNLEGNICALKIPT